MEGWTQAANRSPIFVGKRLSEISRSVLGGGLSGEDTSVACRALALGWLEIIANHDNALKQQEIDARMDPR